MNKKLLLLCVSMLFATIGFSQTDKFNHQVGISAKVSTNGIGGDIYYRPMKKVAIKAGVEYFTVKLKNKTLKRYVSDAADITVPLAQGYDVTFYSEGKLKTGALSLAVGYQHSKSLYFTAGLAKHLLASKVTGTPLNDIDFGDREIPGGGNVRPKISKEDFGVFNITTNPSNTITPYIGIGIGSYVPTNKSFSFALELGVYYVGRYVLKSTMPEDFNTDNIDYGVPISQEQKDLVSELLKKRIDDVTLNLNNEVNSFIEDINKKIEPYKFYPVLKLTIGFKAFEFKK